MMYNKLYMDTGELVFYVDIDDTIVDTALQVIESVLSKFPMASKTSALDLTQKYWQPSHVPEFQKPEIIDYVNSCLTSADFIRQLKPRTGAVEEIKQLAEIGNIAAYISSRSHKLQTVSEDWLTSQGFPAAQVVLREDSDTNPAWKLEYITAQAETAAAAQPTNSVLIEDNHELVALLPDFADRKGESKLELWLIGNPGLVTNVHKSAPNLRYFSSLSDVYAKIFTGGPHAQA
jgi:uncharacterized HAD superfamily protein